MSDPLAGGPIPPGGAGGAPELAILAQYVRDLSFENPTAPASLVSPQPGTAAPAVNVNVDVGARQLADSNYEVTLTVTAKATRGSDTLFVVELVYAGLFLLRNFAAQHLETMLLVECPRLLFPFARAIVADATRDGGFPPLMINPIDFAQIAQQNRRAAQGPASPLTPMPGISGTA